MIAFLLIDDDELPVAQPTDHHAAPPCAIEPMSKDPHIAEFLRLARDWRGEPPTIKDLCKKLRISRRLLEQRCRAALGRSPMEEIRRINLDRAAHMLVETSTPVKSIAFTCGFSSPIHLSVAFRRQFGVSPRGFRRGGRITT